DLSFVWIAIKLAFKPFLSQTRDSIDKSNLIQNSDDVPDAATASPSKTDVGDADKDDYKFECNCYYFLLEFYISLNGQLCSNLWNTVNSFEKVNSIQVNNPF
ncbi:hypothetical protein RYX36_008195, partial [Vicia faba]